MSRTILVSGGFDPPHIGHVRMFKEASKWGNVIVALNSDDWLMRKKGYIFMPWEERAEIIREFESVYGVTPFDDTDNTACSVIRTFRPHAFANGGDRKKENTPEMDLCDELGIQMLWGIGGSDKPQSSSWLVNKLRENQ